MPKPKLILSIDGGGVRGLVPSIILKELEIKLATNDLKRPLCDYFDLISGTSTGGIIALGLCAPNRHDPKIPACTSEDFVDLYKNKSSSIFGTYNAINIFGYQTEFRYDSAPLEDLLLSHFGDATTDDAIGNFIVTAYEIEQRRTKIFTNLRSDEKTPKYFLRDLARATSAAPTYFDPARVEKLHDPGNFESLVDGALFASNPSMICLMHAVDLGWDLDNVYLLSLGTGSATRPYLYNEVKKWGNLSWVSSSRGVPIVSMLMQSQNSLTEKFIEVFLNSRGTDISKSKCWRIDAPLAKGCGSDDLDDASSQNVRELEIFASKLVNEARNQEILDRVVDIVKG